LAADSAGEMNRGWQNWDYPRHVGMAAVLFRRERLARLTFRWETGKCECLCCCEDLRRAGFAIGYLPGAMAWHRPSPAAPPDGPSGQRGADGRIDGGSLAPGGRLLTAFSRRDFRRFRRQFLTTLRASGNMEPVTAVAYGLYPSEQTILAMQP